MGNPDIERKIADILPELLNYPKETGDKYYIEVARHWIEKGFESASEVWDWVMAGFYEPEEAIFYKSLGIEPAVAQNLAQFIIDKRYGNLATIKITEDKSTILLESIKVKETCKGTGSKIMKSICTIGDMFGKDIRLVPTTEFGSEYERLVGFYRRFGFEYEDGWKMIRNHRKTMIICKNWDD